MNDDNRRRSDRAVRVQTFGRGNAADFTAGSQASALFAEMDTLLHRGLQTRSGNARVLETENVLSLGQILRLALASCVLRLASCGLVVLGLRQSLARITP